MKKTYVIAVIIIVSISVWMFSGVLFPSKKIEGINIEKEASQKEPLRVRVKEIQAQSQALDITVMGKTAIKRMVDIKAELAGKVILTPVEKGQHVKKGDILCQLAEDDRKAQLDRASASLTKAQLDYEGALRLQKDGLISSTNIAASKMALESAKAELTIAQLNVEHLTMRAPFAAFVEDRQAQIGALIERGGICARLLDESSILATGQISERDVHLVKLGQLVKVLLMSGQVLDGKISFIGHVADVQTRTYTIEAELMANNQTVRDGVTAKIMIPLAMVTAHLITPAVLALDDDGKVGVRTVNTNNQVEFYLVNVVREAPEGVWVTGLPPLVKLIVVGQELVAEGDMVVPVTLEDEEKAANKKASAGKQ